MKYRSRTEIIEMILRAANSGATKTRIMYAAYLSFAQIQEYLKFMRTKNLLRFEEETQLYRLTEQGMRFLQACEQMSEMMALDKSPQTSTIQTQAISQKAW